MPQPGCKDKQELFSTTMNNVYITDIAAFLPNKPVNNDDIEKLLGLGNSLPSRTKKIILKNNGIETRHYAIDPETRELTHTNAQLAAEAVAKLKPYANFSPEDISCLCCGSSTPDQFMPGHASMVHGELKGSSCEIVSTAGVCLSGITALKYAYLNVGAGLTPNAVATGSELASSYLRAEFLEKGPDREKIDKLEQKPALSFEADFLRWMLSDGAGAAFLGTEPRPDGKSLRIDWIDIVSHAHRYEPCMYAGANKDKNGELRGWRECDSLPEALNREFFPIKQDARLLNRRILTAVVDESLPGIIKARNLEPDNISWFLPHYSSEYFRIPVFNHLTEIGFTIPLERWFTNLATKGNTGSASIYIIMEELMKTGRLSRGETLLCFIPESGRFSTAYMHLTVV